MTGITSISAASSLHTQALGGSRSSAASSGSTAGPGASGNVTSTATNADGTTTTTVTNTQGQVVSSSTSAKPNQAAIASGFALQANQDELAKSMPASLLNMVV